MKKSLQTIAEWLNINDEVTADVMVSGVSINTKTIQPGDLFIPFKGEKVNGHQYVTQAFEKGASAALWQKDEPNPPQNLPLLFVEDSETALQQMARRISERTSGYIHWYYGIEWQNIRLKI